MPSNVSIKEFRRLFRKYGATFTRGGKHEHLNFRRSDGKHVVFPFGVIGGKEVLYIYVTKARKACGLTAKDGISDEEFFS